MTKVLLNHFESMHRIFVPDGPNLFTKVYSTILFLFPLVVALGVWESWWWHRVKVLLFYLAWMGTFAIILWTKRA
ncbi:MAG: hypothetical protein QGI86_01040 [Candidatus Poribacteria bacterium]|nr:hypothetical protein [Candidatus Poribacteria bacterium]